MISTINDPNPDPSRKELFAASKQDRPPTSRLPWVLVAVAVLLSLAVLLFAGQRGPHVQPTSSTNALLPLDAYAATLPVSAIIMSESTSLSGGKSTFLDGHIRNTGPKTVTAATVQVLFANDESMPPQIETLPMTLIRTREPYIDTQLLRAAPMAPGDEREFRLIFENIAANWNQQVPQIRVITVTTR